MANAPNHYGPRVEKVLELIRAIGCAAPSSYGMVYLHNDEAREKDDEFRVPVLVIRRGKMVEHSDPFLSPLVPMIDDD